MRLAARLVLALALLGAAWTSASAARRRVTIVRGHDGDPDLRIDRGRRLRKLDADRGLSAIERVRASARRLAVTTPDPQELVTTLLRLVRLHLPPNEETLAAHLRMSKRELRAGQPTILGRRVTAGLGGCRERSFLLLTMLHEVGIEGEVIYGQLYPTDGSSDVGHALVRARLGETTLLLDPSWYARPVAYQTRLVSERDPAGKVRRVRAFVTDEFTFVPDDSLEYVP